MRDDLIKILGLAASAPSSHNTQPWKVQLGKNSLVIGYETSRQLLVGDPQKRELMMSLGCYIESIVSVAADLEYDARVVFTGTQPSGVAKIILRKASSEPSQWSHLIAIRHSDRRFYDVQPLPIKLTANLEKLSYASARLRLFSQPVDILFLAKMTYDATAEIMADVAFREELSSWVRNNWTKQSDGMPGYTQGMPGPVSLLAKFVIRKNQKVAISQAKKDSQRVRHSAAVGLICVEKNNPEDWLAAGRLYQKACLLALQNDVKTSAISAAVIDFSTTKKITEHLALTNKPIALFRLGYKGGTVRATPRRSVSDVLQQS